MKVTLRRTATRVVKTAILGMTATKAWPADYVPEMTPPPAPPAMWQFTPDANNTWHDGLQMAVPAWETSGDLRELISNGWSDDLIGTTHPIHGGAHPDVGDRLAWKDITITAEHIHTTVFYGRFEFGTGLHFGFGHTPLTGCHLDLPTDANKFIYAVSGGNDGEWTISTGGQFNSGVKPASPSDLRLQSEYHVWEFARIGTTVTIYCDGIKYAESTGHGTVNGNDVVSVPYGTTMRDFHIGLPTSCGGPPLESFLGSIYVWNRALTEAERARIVWDPWAPVRDAPVYTPPTYPTSVVETVPGDCDGDGLVGSSDVQAYFANAAATGEVTVRQADVNRDRVVDFDDYTIIINNLNAQVDPIPPIDSMNITTTQNGSQVQMVDNSNGRTILPMSDIVTYYGYWLPAAIPGEPAITFDGTQRLMPASHAPSVVSVSVTSTPDGFDARITMDNDPSTGVRALGRIELSGLDIGDAPVGIVRDFQWGGAARAMGRNIGAARYPNALYAPVQVIETEDYIVGASIQYPVLDYKHSIVASAGKMSTNPQSDWRIYFDLNSDGTSSVTDVYKEHANLQPGETLEYILSVRVMKKVAGLPDNEWMRTLRPYRRWHWWLYGQGVQYTRNPEPVSANQLADKQLLSLSNPYGFGASRIDLNGMGSTLTTLVNHANLGWPRAMIWAPTGLYRVNTQNNFPPQFTSEWSNMVGIQDPPAISAYENVTGRSLGLWWGNAARVADQWDDPMLDSFDTADATQRATMLGELAYAVVDTQVSMIGLDALTHMDPWESFWWVRDLQELYPAATFVTEDQHSDLMHTVAPNFSTATEPASVPGDEIFRYPDGIPIVDFLNPGHEHWGMVEKRWMATFYGTPNPTEAQTEAIIQRAADFGFVPVYGGPKFHRGPNDHVGTDSWLVTVPADMQVP